MTNQGYNITDSKSVVNNTYVSLWVEKQLFGIPVLQVQDVLLAQLVTPVPRAPREVLGAINLRGRIVTVIDIRKKLNLLPVAEGAKTMQVVVTHEDELYSLVVDNVGDVLDLPSDSFSQNPDNLSPDWQIISSGVYTMQNALMIVLDIEKLLGMKI